MSPFRENTKHILIILLALAVTFLCTASAELEVHFLDVGQGDATLLICDGEAMLIDGGLKSQGQFIYAYLRSHVDMLTYVIATHPDSDHIGGLASALNAVPVEILYTPILDYDSRVFSAMMTYAGLQGTYVDVPMEGDTFPLGSATVTVLHCWPEAWQNNDMSIVLRVDYGSTSFIFTGDAESMSEYMMIDSGLPLDADVLKVAHHGSRYSSTQEFIDAISPTYAVISCGKDNSYGHPHSQTLERLADSIILRTDMYGTIILRSDGTNINVVAPVFDPPPVEGFIGNRSSMKYHIPSCDAVKEIELRNTIALRTKEEAEAAGYDACGLCCP